MTILKGIITVFYVIRVWLNIGVPNYVYLIVSGREFSSVRRSSAPGQNWYYWVYLWCHDIRIFSSSICFPCLSKTWLSLLKSFTNIYCLNHRYIDFSRHLTYTQKIVSYLTQFFKHSKFFRLKVIQTNMYSTYFWAKVCRVDRNNS